ncbi:MAG TPA: hypothetical protein VHQ41_02395 [Patescibacteria group bacterium]|nr:hypothetical protein [Patescibacteria group bacterium]
MDESEELTDIAVPEIDFSKVIKLINKTFKPKAKDYVAEIARVHTTILEKLKYSKSDYNELHVIKVVRSFLFANGMPRLISRLYLPLVLALCRKHGYAVINYDKIEAWTTMARKRYGFREATEEKIERALDELKGREDLVSEGKVITSAYYEDERPDRILRRKGIQFSVRYQPPKEGTLKAEVEKLLQTKDFVGWQTRIQIAKLMVALAKVGKEDATYKSVANTVGKIRNQWKLDQEAVKKAWGQVQTQEV